MKNLIIMLMAVFIIAVVGGCQIAAAVAPVAVGYDNNSTRLTVKIIQPQDETVVRSTPLAVSGTVNVPAQVTVNGVGVDVKDNHFNTTIDLDPGPNSIDVSATDSKGNETFKSVSVVYVP